MMFLGRQIYWILRLDLSKILLTALLLNSIAFFFIASSWPVVGTIKTAKIEPLNGNAYVAQPDLRVDWPYHIIADSLERPYASDFVLQENELELGPSHSLHIKIASTGAGAYSYWKNTLYFAASDNSDPRKNGRQYSFIVSKSLSPSVQILLFAAVIIANAVFVFYFRADLKAQLPKYRDLTLFMATEAALFLRPRLSRIAIALASLALVIAILAASGVFGRIALASPGPPKDGALAFAVGYHVLLGCLTSIGLWGAGAGLIRVVPSFRSATAAQILLPAFPLSLVLTAVLSGVALMLPLGRPIALIVLIACWAPLFIWRLKRRELLSLMNAAAIIMSLAAIFGIWLGLLWHGPTDTLSSAPSGDLSFYAGSIWTLSAQPYPHVNFGYENAALRSYFNQLYPALGAALLGLPGFDPFLFLLCGGGTSYIIFTGLSLHIFLVESRARSIGALNISLIVIAFIVAARYPYWVVESIPVIYVPALTISVWWMAERGKSSTAWSIAAVVGAVAGTALSKVVSATILVPLAGRRLKSQLIHGPFALRAMIYVTGGVCAAYAAMTTSRFLPQIMAAGVFGPESLRTPVWYFLLRDFGALALIPLAWMTTGPAVTIGLTLGLASFLLYSFLFQINFVVAVITFGLIAASAPMASVGLRVCVLAALGFALPAALFGEPSGVLTGVVWIICVGGAACAAIYTAHENPRVRIRSIVFGTTFTVAMATTVLIGVARGSLIVDSGWFRVQRDILTPDIKHIWSAVREITPPDALIFTETDDTANLLGGWNTYAFSGQRTVFISSYYTTSELRGHADALEKVLAINNAVLSGKTSPRDLVTQFYHGSFYAVVLASRSVPTGWRKLTANKLYALYEIPT